MRFWDSGLCFSQPVDLLLFIQLVSSQKHVKDMMSALVSEGLKSVKTEPFRVMPYFRRPSTV